MSSVEMAGSGNDAGSSEPVLEILRRLALMPPIREFMPGKVKFLFGLANDEIGYIIPKSEWDRKPPYLYGSKHGVYGEINSVGPDTAGVIHAALLQMSKPR